MLTLPICCSCPVCCVKHLQTRVLHTKPSKLQLKPTSPVARRIEEFYLELIDEGRDYDVLVRVAVKISDRRSGINAGRHLSCPFQLDILGTHAVTWLLVTACTPA